MTSPARAPEDARPTWPPDLPAVVGAGSSFEGVLAMPGPARIDGSLRGRVVGQGSLWIGPEARVEADLDLDSVIVEGRVRGYIRARARIELLDSAIVEGDLSAPILQVADGCRWNGRSRTRGAD